MHTYFDKISFCGSGKYKKRNENKIPQGEYDLIGSYFDGVCYCKLNDENIFINENEVLKFKKELSKK